MKTNNPTTIKDIIKHLQDTYNPDDKAIAIIWGEDDVRCMNIVDDVSETDDQSEFEGTPLTDDQVSTILNNLVHNHDCECGISWDVVRDHAEEHK